LAADAAGHELKRWGILKRARQWATVREDYRPREHVGITFRTITLVAALRWRTACRYHRPRMRPASPRIVEWPRPHLEAKAIGLTGPEGNHGEDVKTILTSIRLRHVSKHSTTFQTEFPYARLIEENRRRTKLDPNLSNRHGVPRRNRYFDVFVNMVWPDDI
jgi:hypothetical protein